MGKLRGVPTVYPQANEIVFDAHRLSPLVWTIEATLKNLPENLLLKKGLGQDDNKRQR
jgi:hypothetical protein